MAQEYKKKCDIIKKLITQTYPNEKFEYLIQPGTGLLQIVMNPNTSKPLTRLSILPNNNWRELKRRIDKYLSFETLSDECDICFEKISNSVICGKCSFRYCGDCYIKMLDDSEGMLKCPCCRDTWGFYHATWCFCR